MKTLNNLNMKYVSSSCNEELENGAVLSCGYWDKEQIEDWLGNSHLYDFYMLDLIQHWLNKESYVAEGLYLKVWLD